jgi:hypothetical protein
VSGRWEAHEAVVSRKRFEVLTDTGEVHAFGPRSRYCRIAFFMDPASKQSIVEIDPDWHRLLKDICEGDVMADMSMTDVMADADNRRAVLKLLRTWPCFGEPQDQKLARKMLNRVANELERMWWPKAGRPALVPPKILRYYVDAFEAINRKQGVVHQPRTTALKDAKELFGYRSVEVVRKAMQPSRHRRPKPA